jgi:hypothetical protein
MIMRLLAVIAGFVIFSANTAASAESDPAAAWLQFATEGFAAEPQVRFPHETCFRVAALEYGLPYALLLAVARGESDFDEMARSRANAHGIMQILWPVTANHLGIFRLSELYEPCVNIDAGARYLREMLERYDDDIHLALAAYNYGPERISRNGGDIPDGASWYSGYILRHLNFVLGGGSVVQPAGEQLYSKYGRSTLLTFGEPYRAAAFISGLEQRSPGIQLDWFREGTGQFAVVLLYSDKAEFDRSASILRRAGFRLD